MRCREWKLSEEHGGKGITVSSPHGITPILQKHNEQSEFYGISMHDGCWERYQRVSDMCNGKVQGFGMMVGGGVLS